MKKCPPGVICIENFTIFILVIIISILCYFFFSKKQNINISTNLRTTNVDQNQRPDEVAGLFGFMPSYPYNNLPAKDVLLNPYAAPFRDERYFVPELSYVPRNGVPINVSTNAVDTTYRQIGILTPLNGSSKDNILPLMGRPLFTRRSLWQYYTISNQHNNVKLPVSVKGRSGLNENGVDEIYSGDTVYVEGYNDAFKVTKYENDTIKYLPFI
jgi:hypothetical protein